MDIQVFRVNVTFNGEKVTVKWSTMPDAHSLGISPFKGDYSESVGDNGYDRILADALYQGIVHAGSHLRREALGAWGEQQLW